MNRQQILSIAEEYITKDRAATHGEAENNFANIAALWSICLGTEVSMKQVALMMVLLKVAREAQSDNPDHYDNWVDMVGYAALGAELS